jgi:hypothetical protein
MNPTHTKKWLALALALTNGFFAAAQSSTAPGPADYARFTSFITERNIFDPNRYPHDSRARHTTYTPRRSSPSAPTFTLVGTMSYGKGMFAFFDGNNSDLRKVLYQSDTNGIAGFTVTEITLTGVKLQSADKKETVPMKIGEMMRQEGDHWQPVGQGELAAVAGDANAASAATDNSYSPDTSSAPSPALNGNEILKKLMQQREQELK